MARRGGARRTRKPMGSGCGPSGAWPAAGAGLGAGSAAAGCGRGLRRGRGLPGLGDPASPLQVHTQPGPRRRHPRLARGHVQAQRGWRLRGGHTARGERVGVCSLGRRPSGVHADPGDVTGAQDWRNAGGASRRRRLPGSSGNGGRPCHLCEFLAPGRCSAPRCPRNGCRDGSWKEGPPPARQVGPSRVQEEPEAAGQGTGAAAFVGRGGPYVLGQADSSAPQGSPRQGSAAPALEGKKRGPRGSVLHPGAGRGVLLAKGQL